VYFIKAGRLNITSNTDGKTISLQRSKEKEDCILTRDYTVSNGIADGLGDCQIIDETPICFCVTEDKIAVSFANTKTVINFL
jgi:hypothetical protein